MGAGDLGGRASTTPLHRAAALLVALFALGLLTSSPATAQAPSFDANGSVRQVYVTGLQNGARAFLLRNNRVVKSKKASRLGGLLFRGVKPGGGYRVRLGRRGPRSGPIRVLTARSAPPSTDVYNQTLPTDGYGYLTTRDGTQLAINVHPPTDAGTALGIELPPVPPGPTPTLIEYSGYGYADPDGPESGISVIANALGFTVVDVNMRGTGCSGGAFDFFEPLQGLDGYDVIETVARQPWVKGDKVGMMGISYGGISQLFVGATRPPSLAAITPISLIDAVQTTLYPGGILNTGFAFEWAKDRIEDSRPAGPGPRQGQRWAYERIQEGDQVCKANQVLHPEAADLRTKIRRNRTYRPRVADPLSPITFVHKINVPTFLACQWEDEQTGGHCPTLASRFTGTNKKWFTFTNGTHVDSLAPETFNKWFDFLKLYVAKEPPIVYAPVVQALGPVVYEAAMGIQGVTMPPDPVQQEPTYDGALEEFESQPPVRILFDNGAGGSEPGHPLPGFQKYFAKWPVPGTRARRWFLARGGALRERQPRQAGAVRFRPDADARPSDNHEGSTGAGENGIWTATPKYRWTQNPPGTALSFVTQPLRRDTTVVGAGAVHLFLRSSRPNVDFQATVTEVRPDGKEVFVQGGWVRGNMRALDPRKSTRLAPVLSLRARDISPLPSDRYTRLTIPLYYQGHAYRKRSRIRIIISAPNGDQPIWDFDHTAPARPARVVVRYSKKHPSRLVLPVVRGVNVPTGLPPCPGLRAEPCRDYKRFRNRTARG